MADRRAISRRPKKGPSHGVWAHGLQLSPYPHMGPIWATHIARAHIKKHEQTLLIFPKLRAHNARAHNVRPHCAPIWVIWGPLNPYGFMGSHMGPHTAALVEKWARAMSGRTTLPRALERFYFEPSGGRTSESPTISTFPSRFSSSGRFSLASARESGASNRPPLSRANHDALSRHQTQRTPGVIRPHPNRALSGEIQKLGKKKRPTLTIKKQGLLFIRPAGKNTSSSVRSKKKIPEEGALSNKKRGSRRIKRPALFRVDAPMRVARAWLSAAASIASQLRAPAALMRSISSWSRAYMTRSMACR
jgi:hypothetical protein